MLGIEYSPCYHCDKTKCSFCELTRYKDSQQKKEASEMAELKAKADYAEVKHGRWFLLDECSNEGVYCSVCHKKVYRKEYANQKLKSDFCPNCGANMKDGDGDA